VVNALLEETVPDSADAMVWTCSDHGMQMTLARDVPERVGRHLRDFVRRLVERAGIGQDELHRALYAVHPGGPRILDGVRDALEIGEEKLSFSRELLHERGNLSSATLPHVWMQIAESDRVGAGSPVVSLAFGPGLTLSGAVMQKVVSN
jgi:predicted naringenin-chalcone synthase